MDRDRIFIGFINTGGARINESTPVVNHPGVGIYLNPGVEIVRAAAREDACGHLQTCSSKSARPYRSVEAAVILFGVE
jgi:hypothetical protein